MYGAYNGSAVSAAAPFATGDGGAVPGGQQRQAMTGRRASIKGRDDAGWNGGSWGADAREESEPPSGRSASRSSLVSAGSAIGNAGSGYSSSRSQITFGNGSVETPKNGFTRFAGKTNQSSISFGTGEDTRFQAPTIQSRKTPQDFATQSQQPQDFSRNHNGSFQAEFEPSRSTFQSAAPTYVGASEPAPFTPREQAAGSIPGNSSMSPLMDKLISEIAELRVKNQDLESYVDHLERKLAMYEGAPQ